ncbi:Diguanylate cyclase, GGDEF domain [Modicisalibacter ilicicola DSM 19980]|uniref:Diguanylate cyclase, GGDEF domain n=1 Tax=Modicisalibacter ilicicola DSM 19980 TaxID=1121942 RepID=A0A1M5BUV0_9GAMM|nr:diguanylate cyclase [Halomonas ilicicola]SHF46309.1 Diguanylate cyclase, GGDEF domain [Halomonas ilicicola DSM 19980]
MPRVEMNSWPSRLAMAAYASGVLLLAGYALWNYLMGSYGRILLPTLLSLLLAGALFLRSINKDYRHLCAYLALISCYLLVAIELPALGDETIFWLGLPPTLTLLLLPLGSALLLNLTMTPVWLTLANNDLSLLDTALYYLALMSVAAIPQWLRQRREMLSSTTESRDGQCDALSRHALLERLKAEVERARVMKRPLATLIIHLPQLEMADEQFGTALLHTLLERLCRTVRSCCRYHDPLGRHQTTLFWLLLPDTGEAGALIVRERLLSALSREVFAETGAIQPRIRACYLHPGEDAVHFEQRLLATGLKLMEPAS